MARQRKNRPTESDTPISREEAQPYSPTPVTTRNVLMLAPTMFFADYGAHVRIYEEALSLKALGHQLRILAYPNGRDIGGLDVRRCWGVPFNYRIVVGSHRHKFYLDAMLAMTALNEVTFRYPDVIHAHMHEGALIGKAATFFRPTPLLFDLQGSLTGEMVDHGWLRHGGKRLAFMRWIEQSINRLPSAIITSSTQAADMLMRDFDLSSERIFPILDSVNTDVFRQRTSEDHADLTQLRAELGIPEGRTLVVYLGLLAEYQGTSLLIQSAQQLLQQRNDLHFLIMGFPSEERYRDEAIALGIGNHTTFTGRLPYDQAARYLRLGDIAVAPKMSATEGSGKLLNYMAVGLPTVAFDTQVSREYLGNWGYYAPDMTPTSFAQTLGELIENQHEWTTMGNALRDRVQRKFSWENAGRQISEIYDVIT